MKSEPKPKRKPSTGAPETENLPLWVFAAALVAGLIVYLPALNGPFVFDDLTIEALQQAPDAPLRFSLSGPRPLYYLSLQAQHRLHAGDPFPFHLVNWLLHAANTLLLFGILRRYMRLGGLAPPADRLAAGFGAGVFLLHPLNTEAVSYIASRSEVLSALFAFLAWRLFLDRRQPRLPWAAAAGIVLLLALGLGVKEHVIALVAVLFLTDAVFGGLRANLRFYVPLGVLAAGAAVYLVSRLGNNTAGFGVAGVTPLSYLVTQGAVIWRYLQLAVAPIGQSVDHGYPIAVSALGVAGLAALAAASVYLWRNGPKLAWFGWLCFLACLAPTSSVVPIADAMVERRMYLAMPGLALVVAPWLKRLNVWTLAGILVVFAVFTWQRNEKWGSAEGLWRDAVAGNPANARAQFQLAYALYLDGRCGESVKHYELAGKHGGPVLGLYQNWALALDCDGRAEEALAVLAREGDGGYARWATEGMIQGKRGRAPEALAALDRAIELNPNFAMSWVYRGNVLLAAGRREEAIAAFRRALEVDPDNAPARQALALATGR